MFILDYQNARVLMRDNFDYLLNPQNKIHLSQCINFNIIIYIASTPYDI